MAKKSKRYLAVNNIDGTESKIEITQAFRRPKDSRIAFQVDIEDGMAMVSFNPSLIDVAKTECVRIDRNGINRNIVVTDRDGGETSFIISKAYERFSNSSVAFQIEMNGHGSVSVSYNVKLIDVSKINSICIDRED